jgi:multiple sugar transport system permease protein
MSAKQEALAVETPVASSRQQPSPHHRTPRGSDARWAVAFAAPYVAVFFAFVVYPYGYALWIASKPSLYAELIADHSYLAALVNTLLFVGLGVNLKMFCAFLLSGFFLRRRWWIRGLLGVYVLPWAIATAQACVSFHWMLQGDLGLINRLLAELFGLNGPIWFNHRWLGVGWNIAAYIWKWMPFWTLVFLAARMKISRELYDAAAIDGATGYRQFVHVTVPLLANLYLLCTLVSTLWTIGDFTTVYLVSGGGAGGSMEVLSTLGFRYAFAIGRPELGVAAVMSALPVLIPLVTVLMRRVEMSEVRL